MLSLPRLNRADLRPLDGHALSLRRRELRRRRRRGLNQLLGRAGWSFAILLVGWLLISGLSGLPYG